MMLNEGIKGGRLYGSGVGAYYPVAKISVCMD
jgi:hypothetical protein